MATWFVVYSEIESVEFQAAKTSARIRDHRTRSVYWKRWCAMLVSQTSPSSRTSLAVIFDVKNQPYPSGDAERSSDEICTCYRDNSLPA